MRKWASKILVPAIMVGLAAVQSFGIDASRASRYSWAWYPDDSLSSELAVGDSVSDSLRHVNDSIQHRQDSLRAVAQHIADSLRQVRDSILDARAAAAQPAIDSLRPIAEKLDRRLDSLRTVSLSLKATIDSLDTLRRPYLALDSLSAEDSVALAGLDSIRRGYVASRYVVQSDISTIRASYKYKNTNWLLHKLAVRNWDRDSMFIDSVRAQVDSFGYDAIDSMVLVELDSLEKMYEEPYIGVRDTLTFPDSLEYKDPFKFKYYLAIKDTTWKKHVRDSLLAIPDSIELAKLDSLYIKDSTEVAQWKFGLWYNSLSKKERKKYDYEQALPAKIARMDSILHRKDSIKAYKDSVIEATPRILETYVVADSLQYKRLILWTHDRKFNDITLQKFDTTFNYHFNDCKFLKEDVDATYLGISGSAEQHFNFFRRRVEEDVPFYTPYQVYSYRPEDLPQYNTKTPYTELAYWGTLFSNQKKEEGNLKILTTQNITPELNLSLGYERYGAGGILQNESTNNRTAFIGTNYIGKRYLMHAGFIHNRVMRTENGGVIDWSNTYNINMVRDTTLKDLRELPVRLNDASSVLRKQTVFLDQSYRIPFSFLTNLRGRKARLAYRDSIMTSGDTLAIRDYLAYEAHLEEEANTLNRDVTSAFIGHSFEFSNFRRSYTDNITASDTSGRGLFKNYYMNPTKSADSLRVMRLDNKVYIRLQPWKADGIVSKLDIGIGDKFMIYNDLTPDGYLGAGSKVKQNSLYAYAGVQGQYKKYLHWDASGNYTFLGAEINDFGVNANLKLDFFPFRRYRDEPLTLKAHFETTLSEPDYYQQHLHINHFRWDNDFSKVSQTKVTAALEIPRWKLDAQFGYALLSNNIYYNTLGLAAQNPDAMSVITASLDKEFVLWKFHLDHRLLLQFSSNQDVLPLPLFAMNLRYYFQFDVVKQVMKMQIGVNGWYNTRWHAPSYNPAFGVFYNQDHTLYGNRPTVDAFVNVQWKRACIFLKVVNVAMGWPFDSVDYYSADRYLKPVRAFKIGVFWPFYVQPSTKSTASATSGEGGGSGRPGGSRVGGGGGRPMGAGSMGAGKARPNAAR